jgi:hypothetical protein
MLARVFAAYLAYEAGPAGMFRSDRHFRHQLALLVLRLGSGAKVNGGKNGGRMGVAIREAMAHRLCSALGPLALNAARAMAPSLPGVPIPESAPQRVDGSFHSFSISQHGDGNTPIRS